MIQNVSVQDDKLVILTTDEVEAVGCVKVRLVLTFLYGDFCVREAYNQFHCEGCEKHWPSQNDHECLLLSEEEIFERGYDDVRTRINHNAFLKICRKLNKMADIPMTPNWETFIKSLFKASAHTVFHFWEDMVHTWNHEEQIIVDYIHMTRNVVQNEGDWDTEVYYSFVKFMKDE